MTVYVRRWKTKTGEVKEAYRYDSSIRRPGEPEGVATRDRYPAHRSAVGQQRRSSGKSSLPCSTGATMLRAPPRRRMRRDVRQSRSTPRRFSPRARAWIRGPANAKCAPNAPSSRATWSHLWPHGVEGLLDRADHRVHESSGSDTEAQGQALFQKEDDHEPRRGAVGPSPARLPKHVERMPTIKWPRPPQPHPRFYTFEQAAALVEASGAEPSGIR